jgi:hypothetical protein
VTAAIALTIPLAGGIANAADEAPSDAASTVMLRAQADAIAVHYLDALTRYQTLDRAIAGAQAEIKVLRARAHTARVEVRERAVTAYLGSGARLPSIVDSSDAMDAARRIQFIDQVNGHTRAVYVRLRTATKDLDDRRRALESDRQHQASALDDLKAQGSAMNAKLALAQQRDQAAQAAMQAAAQAATATAAAAPTAAGAPAAGQPLDPSSTTTNPPATPRAAPAQPTTSPPAPVAPPGYSGTPGTSPHHDDPFLTCVRARESGGNYGAVNPAGPYLGAYQFLQATWNGAANHAGRADLVGVPANHATPFDQDEIAWSLYQWQGMGPWGGGCG